MFVSVIGHFTNPKLFSLMLIFGHILEYDIKYQPVSLLLLIFDGIE